nr:hypothetical protein [Paraburkholderia terricola]
METCHPYLRHWTVYNIPAAAAQLPEGAGNAPSRLPIGVNPRTNDFQNTGAAGADGNHGGPCPPVGDKPHRYSGRNRPCPVAVTAGRSSRARHTQSHESFSRAGRLAHVANRLTVIIRPLITSFSSSDTPDRLLSCALSYSR